VRLELSSEQNDLRLALADFLAHRLTDGHAHEFVDAGASYDPALWKSLASELGLAGLIVDERLGGAGAGLVELAVVFEQAGKAQLCSPLFATAALAAPLLLAAPAGVERDALLCRIAAGDCTATAVATDPSGTSALTVTDDLRVSGDAGPTVDGASADVLVVLAETDPTQGRRDGPVLMAVRRQASEVLVHPVPSLDPTRPLAAVTLDGAEGVLLASGSDLAAVARRAWAVSSVLLAAEQLGGLQASLDLAVSYAKSRVQFNRPIGAFQAIKHRCADMFVDLELSRWTVYLAACMLGSGHAGDPAEAVQLAAQTRAVVSTAFSRASASLLQVLGGIGYTWEHDAHLFFKRAAASARLLGTVEDMFDVVADGIGLDRP
jgi:alkylation response protein AidB-like acyl-CoA dehydrogenase